MALVNCPECGKENVSDNADRCPSCGFGLKEYFENERHKENAARMRKIRLENVKMPTKPSRWNCFSVIAIICALTFALDFYLYVDSFYDSEIGVQLLLILPCFLLFFYQGVKTYNEQMKAYNTALSDFEAYRQDVIQQQEWVEFCESLKEKCPKCQSTKIERITTIDRAVSVATVGIASGKIGKQYRCRNCKHMW